MKIKKDLKAYEWKIKDKRKKKERKKERKKESDKVLRKMIKEKKTREDTFFLTLFRVKRVRKKCIEL